MIVVLFCPPLFASPAPVDLSESGLKTALQTESVLSPWFSLKLASLYVAQGRHAEAVSLLEKTPEVPEPLFPFWRHTLLAQAYLGAEGANRALALLEKLPPEPDIEKTPNQTFYRTLYREALEAADRRVEGPGVEEDVHTTTGAAALTWRAAPAACPARAPANSQK